ncbi:tRNA (cytosine-5-)-methyltransferase ncl1 [Microsporum audouinii]
MFEPIRWLHPLFDALFGFSIPFTYRWRLLILQPISILTCAMKWVPWVFLQRYSSIQIPLRRTPGQSVRAIVFLPQDDSGLTLKTSRGLRPLHLDFHGGGFIGGNPEHDAEFCSALSDELGVVVISATYRFAPRHSFPVANEDAQDVALFLIENAERLWKADPQVLTVSGFSAGGNLALGVAQGLAGTDHSVKGSVTFYAPVDLRKSPSEKPVPSGKADPLEVLKPLFDAYPGPVRSRNMKNPLMNPVLADITTLPPRMAFVVPKIDILYEEQISMIRRLKAEAEQLNVSGQKSATGADTEAELEQRTKYTRIRKGTYQISHLEFPEGFHGWLEVPEIVVGDKDKRKAFIFAFDFLKEGSKGGSRGTRPANYSTTLVRENKNYEKYYNSLQIVPEEEKQEFWDALRRDLPNSFRFTGSRSHALALQQRLKDFYIPNITSIRYEGELVEPPQPVPWYPEQLAWSMTTPKSVVRRFAPFSSFQKFLVSETEVGNISRQEVVSMIPPLLLDVRPGMVVLDMCAAPGSKSAQLMEMIHAGEEERMAKISQKLETTDETTRQNGAVKVVDLLNGEPEAAEADAVEDDGRSTGLLIANDSDYKRAHLLIHQMKRLNSPNLLVTNHDATVYPSIKLPSISIDGQPAKNRYLKFDRILADVPCSGDGTTRKNFNLWNDWNPANGIGLFATQARILFRALQMLKVGGRVVYSTCSMNPIENEAVIAHVIDRCGGSGKVEIVDCAKELPELKRRPGLTTWKIMDKTGRIYENWAEAEEEVRKLNPAASRLVEGMFPPSGDAEIGDLTRCMRVYPHMQDTGGFFITVLEKKREIKVKSESTKAATATPQASASAPVSGPTTIEKDGEDEPLVPENGAAAAESGQDAAASTLKRGSEDLEQPQAKRAKVTDSAQEEADKVADTKPTEAPSTSASTVAPPKLKRKQQSSFEEPFKYLDSNREDLDEIFKYFRLSPQFPRDRFMVRNAEGRPAKTIYYTTVLARDILTENESTGMKFVHCGVKMFVKQDVQKPNVCPWRIQMEGLPVIESWVGMNRVVKMYTKSTLKKLLVEMFPKVNDGGWKELGEIGERVRDMEMGCYILRLEASDREDGFRERMVFPLWRSAYSVNLMLPKEERRAVLLRLFDDDTPLVNSTQKREAAAAKAKEGINIADYDSELEGNDNINGEANGDDADAEPEAEAEITAGENDAQGDV